MPHPDPHPRPDPHDPVRARAAVAAAHAELPETHRELLALVRGGLGYREVSDRWGMPVDRVRVLALHAVLALTRARQATAEAAAAG